MAMISKGITLSLDTEKVVGLQNTPEISETTEKLETTDLESENKTYVNGLKDFGDALSFQVLYTKEEFGKVRALQDGAEHDALITYPDGMTVAFKAFVATVLSGAEVNSVLTFNIELTPASAITVTVA